MRVTVDYDLCDSNALCASACPEVFEVGEDDVLRVLDPSPPESLRAGVELAANSCPKFAITIADD